MTKVYDKGAGSNALREEVSPPHLPAGSPVAGGFSVEDLLRIARYVNATNWAIAVDEDSRCRFFAIHIFSSILEKDSDSALAFARNLGFGRTAEVIIGAES